MPVRNEHVIAIMLEPVAVAQEFIEWPLHITIVPWFPCDDGKKLDKLLADIAQKHSKFSLEVGDIERFGPKKDVKVNLINDSPQLDSLHWNVFNKLEKNGFGIHQKTFVGNGYKAHITHQPHAQARPGDKVLVGSFALVSQIRQKKTGTMIKAVKKEYSLA